MEPSYKVDQMVRVLHSDFREIPVGTLTSIVRISSDFGLYLFCKEYPRGMFFTHEEVEPVPPDFGVPDKPRGSLETQVGGSHYHDKAMQPWLIIEAWELDFWQGNALKYLLRYPYKGGVEDLRKCKHYIEYLIDRACNT